MKNIIKFIAAAACVGALMPAGFSSCTDMDGDGVDSIVWQGSQNPENTSFRNPVWEPSLEAGTVVKGASMYVAISAETQWTSGLTSICPTLTSNNLMTWQRANDGFTADGRPTWAEGGRISSLSVDYARTLRINYWMFYTFDDAKAIGYAFATSGQGPYTDKGELITAESIGSQTIRDPFFIVVSTNYYLCYTADDGVYMQRLTITGTNANAASVRLNGTATKIAAQGIADVAVYRRSATDVYLLFTVQGTNGTEIRYARGAAITGPFLDKSGQDVAGGSHGELLIEGGQEMQNPENPMRAFLNSEQTHLFVAYNATEAGNGQMKSGYARKPMLIAPIELGEDGWATSVAKAQKGWTTPRFE